MARWPDSPYSPLREARDVACACPDVVGFARWIREGCLVHGTRAGARRGVEALVGPMPRRRRPRLEVVR